MKQLVEGIQNTLTKRTAWVLVVVWLGLLIPQVAVGVCNPTDTAFGFMGWTVLYALFKGDDDKWQQ